MVNYWSVKFQTEQNFSENITATQSWQKYVIGSQPPKNGNTVQNSMTYKFLTTNKRKLKISEFISFTERAFKPNFRKI